MSCLRHLPRVHEAGTMGNGAVRREPSGAPRQQVNVRPCRGRHRAVHKRTGGQEPLAHSGTSLECEHFDSCSGCSISDGLDKPPMAQTAAEFFASRGIDNFDVTLDAPCKWRCRAKLAVRASKHDGSVQIGLFRQGTHDVVSIPNCRVHHPRINEAVLLIERIARQLNVTPYDEVSGSGDLRYIQLTASARTYAATPHQAQHDPFASVQVALVWNCPPEEFEKGSSGSVHSLLSLAAALWHVSNGPAGTAPLLHSVWANFNVTRGNLILGREWELLHGDRYLWQHFAGADVCFSPGSFAQVNFATMDICLSRMQQWVPEGAAVVEFHAGVGCIGLSLAASRACASVTGVEVNPTTLDPYLMAKERMLQASLGSGGQLPVLELKVMSAGCDPLTTLKGADVVVMDPPRKGVEPELMQALLDVEKHNVETVIYLSCGFHSFMCDFDKLVGGAGLWRAVHVEGFIFFPGADHIETLAVFRRTV
eukprot:CAMPEP_0117666122 /NCGR_PEP_ID=MMETSP0804-20121206/10195_1 /TAXON_ID=1074897 /ORGANISM="Tetraselmis astigmatica, Strain CCMP880" /LENGTH=479 /DNA_ID=CAMNT_0005473621 /DNA_START=209 /DNA_END=1648 /DNA_ORIENTATION=+